MALSARNIASIEKQYPDGLSSRQIIEVLDSHGERITEATLRKYVQLGLLPRSRRVGEKGKHRGSKGIYPVEVIRRVNEVRRAMADGQTLEELAHATQAVRAKLSSLRVALEETFASARQDLTGEARTGERRGLRSDLGGMERQSKALLKDLEAWTVRLAELDAPKGRSAERKRTAAPSQTRVGRVNRPTKKKVAKTTRKTNSKKSAKKTAAKRARRRGGA